MGREGGKERERDRRFDRQHTLMCLEETWAYRGSFVGPGIERE